MVNNNKKDVWEVYRDVQYRRFLFLSKLTENVRNPFSPLSVKRPIIHFFSKGLKKNPFSWEVLQPASAVDDQIPVWRNSQQPLLPKQKAVRRPERIPLSFTWCRSSFTSFFHLTSLCSRVVTECETGDTEKKSSSPEIAAVGVSTKKHVSLLHLYGWEESGGRKREEDEGGKK